MENPATALLVNDETLMPNKGVRHGSKAIFHRPPYPGFVPDHERANAELTVSGLFVHLKGVRPLLV